MEKPKLYFVPVGISGITYYEKLIPHLQNSYDTGFLLIGYDDVLFSQMIDYCQKKKYLLHVINLGGKREDGIRMPFISPLRKMLAHKKACQEFIKNVQPAKIIFDKTKKPWSVMVHEANRMGIETIRLQWSFLFTTGNSPVSQGRSSPILAKAYYRLIQFFYDVVGLLQGEGYRVNIGNAVTPKKLGVINSNAIKLLLKDFNSMPEKIEVVGTLETQDMHDLKKRVDADRTFKEGLIKKYAVHPQKINILVLGFRLTRLSFVEGKRALSKKEHIAYFENIFTDIQKIFSSEKTHIMFKMHQGDEDPNMYESYRKLGVSLYGEGARVDELMCLSDLCIIDPWTSANFLVSSGDLPAICFDRAPVEGRVAPKEDFKIKEIVDTRERFLEMLRDFKGRKLERQYGVSDINARTAEKIAQFINL